MKSLRLIVRIVLGTIACLWLLLFAVPRIPVVQEYLGREVSHELGKMLGTEVKVGNIELRLPSRIIVDDLYVQDHEGRDMLRANRVSVSAELMPLLSGQIRITSAQIFSLKALLIKKDANSPLNCQFLIDSLKSKDTLNATPLDMRIQSLIIRNSEVRYNDLYVKNLSSHIILNKLTDDSLDLNVKRLHLQEKRGLKVSHLSFMLKAANHNYSLSNMKLRLPNSQVNIPWAQFDYREQGGKIASFSHAISMEGSITPADLAFLDKRINDIQAYNVSLTSKGNEKDTEAQLKVTSRAGLNADIQTRIRDVINNVSGDIDIRNLNATGKFISSLSNYGIKIPQEVTNLGDISLRGKAHANNTKHVKGTADITSSKAGKLSATGEYNNDAITAHIITPGLNLAQITGDKSLGDINGDLHLKTKNVKDLKQNTEVKGTIKEVTYNGYKYHNINVDGRMTGNVVSGKLDVNDPNAMIHAQGVVDIKQQRIISGEADVQNFSASRMNLTNALGSEPINAHLSVSPTNVELTSDIIDVNMQGENINLTTLPRSVMNIVASHLPSMPGIPAYLKHTSPQAVNNCNISMRLKDPSVLRKLLPESIEIPEIATLNGYINTSSSTADLTLDVPTLLVGGQKLSGTQIRFYTPDSSLRSRVTTDFMDQNGPVAVTLDCEGKEDHLLSHLSWDNQREMPFKGTLTTKTQFRRTKQGTTLRVEIPESQFGVGDSLWTVHANEIRYENGTIDIDHFNVGSQTQKVFIDGIASRSLTDSLTCQLSNVDISYILNLVNFHSVEFSGMASGTLTAKGVLGNIVGGGHLDVDHFLFEQGNLGTLHLDANYNPLTQQILLDGICDDSEAEAKTLLNGYVSPSPGEILLDIDAQNSRMEFVETFCSSFMDNSDMRGTGKVRLFGPFDNINLEGKLFVNGAFTLSSTNCRYTLPGDTVTFIPDDIQFHDARLVDKFGNHCLLTGGVHHKHLTRMSYDLDATTTRLLAYDFPTLKQDETFCGHALINGDVGIHGKDNELVISADATPLNGSYLIYNASSPDAIHSTDIITWRSAAESAQYAAHSAKLSGDEAILNAGNERTNIHMNFFIHVNPDAKLHLIMDEATGDYVDLYGNGDLRVNYFNKGGLDVFGNYTTDHGQYKMTIQNLIRRDFTFRKGGTITFGGDPYDALLNMQAMYSINSVPLADLNIGSSFTSNNVPVNCLMNITGTPGKPSVAFDLDLPSLSTDARQMVNSVINSEEEMNQQVLYLLAIGRFYAPSSATLNASSENNTVSNNVGQGTLAVQSFLSGTLSQQFNNAMSGVMSNLLGAGNSISFGANIAPGNEGFSNAEYEGLLSGRLFNNRLLFNGQFGYRDNINTNSQSFIGDFSVQYLLTKSGTISLKVYNQTNDRYFTRNSLDTQGIGVVFQKEFGK
ncbi:MAG: translocation/assembly module TamB [Prevotella sp.]|nr:translocation/assembly module TamB [Prevotella sp.]